MIAIIRSRIAVATMLLAVGCFSVSRAAAQQAPPAQKTFSSPENAVRALLAAVKVHDKAALKDIFGPGIHDLLTGDEKQDRANSQKFAAALAEGAVPVPEEDGTVVLEIGGSKWPFPIPLVKAGDAWRFDTDAGKEEIINRHVGKDELHAIGICRAYAQARKGSGPGTAPKPAHGYIFRLLPRKGGGPFALAAYPDHWGRSGIMTFVVEQDGKLYRRDFGEKTSKIMPSMAEYAPGDTWKPELDQGVAEKSE